VVGRQPPGRHTFVIDFARLLNESPARRRGHASVMEETHFRTIWLSDIHGWDNVLLPIIDCYRVQGHTVVVRADAAFAMPALYEALERREVRYAIRLPANDVLGRSIEDLLTRPRGRPSHAPLVRYRSFEYQAASWDRPRRVIAKIEHHLGELFPRVGFIVTTLTGTNRAVVRFYNQRGAAEHWIKEGKAATHWTRLSCHRFRSNEVRLLLGVIAYNLGNLLRRLVLPLTIQSWSLTSLQ
jgi:Transposase DDE domain group 1